MTTTEKKKRPDLVTMSIQLGELEQSTIMPADFYDRMLAFIAAHPFSLIRMFEIGAVAAMAAYSGDSEAATFIRRDLDPKDRANPRARRRSPKRPKAVKPRTKSSARKT